MDRRAQCFGLICVYGTTYVWQIYNYIYIYRIYNIYIYTLYIQAYMKNPPFNSLVWGSLRLAPIILNFYTERLKFWMASCVMSWLTCHSIALLSWMTFILPAVHNSYFSYLLCCLLLFSSLFSLSLIYSYCITCPLLLCWSVS